jgi:hypothetical protein
MEEVYATVFTPHQSPQRKQGNTPGRMEMGDEFPRLRVGLA